MTSLAVLTLQLRAKLNVIDDAVAEAQDLLDRIEQAGGLVRDDGSRADEASPGGSANDG